MIFGTRLRNILLQKILQITPRPFPQQRILRVWSPGLDGRREMRGSRVYIIGQKQKLSFLFVIILIFVARFSSPPETVAQMLVHYWTAQTSPWEPGKLENVTEAMLRAAFKPTMNELCFVYFLWDGLQLHYAEAEETCTKDQWAVLGPRSVLMRNSFVVILTSEHFHFPAGYSFTSTFSITFFSTTAGHFLAHSRGS